MVRRIKKDTADYIFLMREALCSIGFEKKQSEYIIGLNLEYQGINASQNVINRYSTRTFEEERKRQEAVYKMKRKLSQPYLDFVKSVKLFKKKQKCQISSGNNFFDVLKEMERVDREIRGKRLAEIMDKESVSNEISLLRRLKLLDRTTQQKVRVNKRGKNYLSSVKVTS
jgi:hypothetical protein